MHGMIDFTKSLRFEESYNSIEREVNQMYQLFSAIMMFAFIMLIVGLIKPKWGTFGKAPNMKRWKIFIIWLLIFVVSMNLYNALLPPEIKEAQRIEAENKSKEKAFSENVFVKSLGLKTQEELAAVESAFETVKIDKVENITYDENLGDTPDIKGYRLKGNGFGNVILYMTPDNKVESIRYNTINLYKDGQFLETLPDNSLTVEEETHMQRVTEKTVSKLLKAPSLSLIHI